MTNARSRPSRFRVSPHHGIDVPDRVSIFVTVGTELPFDRLVTAIDRWAAQRCRGNDVFAQIGHTDRPPQHIRSAAILNSADFGRLFATADLVIAHAGMGTILAALERNRPLLVVPRRADLGEHRNDHQRATVDRLRSLGLVDAVDDEHDVIERLDSAPWGANAPASIGAYAEPKLLEAVRSAIHATR